MNIKIEPEILKDLKETLAKKGKTAARFILTDFGCSGPIFDIELGSKMDDDIVVEMDRVKFVAENKFAPALKTPEVIKIGDKFTVKKPACGCGC
ncbi:hypothetical protein AB2Z22_002066 [Clostridium botulinum]